jgi:hypothetical protein
MSTESMTPPPPILPSPRVDRSSVAEFPFFLCSHESKCTDSGFFNCYKERRKLIKLAGATSFQNLSMYLYSASKLNIRTLIQENKGLIALFLKGLSNDIRHCRTSTYHRERNSGRVSVSIFKINT